MIALALACVIGQVPGLANGVQPSGGQGFGIARLDLPPVGGVIELSAPRAWMWRHPQEGGPHTTQRLALDGGVRLRLGTDMFQAERAVVWLQRIETRSTGEGQTEASYQVYAVLEQANRASAAAGAGGIKADMLPLQGVITTTDRVRLRVDLREPGPPLGGAIAELVGQAEARFAQRLARGGVAAVEGGSPEPMPEALPRPARIPDRSLAAVTGRADETGEAPLDGEPAGGVFVAPDRTRGAMPGENQIVTPVPVPSPPIRSGELFTSRGVFAFSVGDKVVVQGGEQSNAVMMSGGVVVQYTEPGGRALEIKSERAVVFLKPQRLVDQFTRFEAGDLLGVYLEGEVLASDGTYTVRGPRAYYDVAGSRAVVLDAVFFTYEQQSGMPLYLRADEVRQESARQFSASNAVLDNTAFFNPAFTLAVREVTVRVYEKDVNDERLGGRSFVDARHVTLKAGGEGGVPVFWWPGYKGDPEQFPLRNVQLSDSNRRGTGIRTRWNALSLIGKETPGGMGFDLLADYYADSGFGLGLAGDWDRNNGHGSGFVYVLPDDNGTDVGTNGREVARDGGARSYIRAQHLQRIDDRWTLRGEVGFVSDPLMLENYFPGEGELGRELTNKLHLQRADGNTLLWGQLNARAEGFIANQNILQAPGYTVDKLPEFGFVQVANDLLPLARPGMLTHTWEASYAHMRMRFSEAPASDYGFDSDPGALFAFGTTASDSLGDLFRSAGMNERFVNRVDTRHELSLDLKKGPVRINPFIVGRVTAYDTAFDSFSPDETSQLRLWGSAGVRIGTELHKVNTKASNAMLDIHRLRHIIEPSLMFWLAGSSIGRGDLPVYDSGVEDLADGTMIRAAVDQTWQTKRGREGHRRSVDWLTLDAEYVYSSGRADRDDPIGRWYDPRPELSNPGEFARVRGTWQASEVLAVAGETIYDFDAGRQARSSIGVLMRHDPRLTASAELKWLEPTDSTYGDLALLFTLTDKYRAHFNTTYNFDVNDFQHFTTRLDRAFPNGTVGLTISYDNIKSETSFGFIFKPFGIRSNAGRSIGSGGGRFGG